MKRPSFQFYPSDWRGNANLRRCSDAARGAWMDILGTLHDSDEYGIVRWPLIELARAAGVSLKLARELAEKLVLKGSDAVHSGYVHTPRHAGKDGEPVTLVPAGDGPCWYSSRMVRDEWRRSISGGPTRFTSDNQPDAKKEPGHKPRRSPSRPYGEDLGDGATTSSSTSSSEVSSLRSDIPPLPDWVPLEQWEAFLLSRKKLRVPMTPRAFALLLKKLARFRDQGQDPGALLDQAVERGWKTIFPLKSDETGGQQNGRPEAKVLSILGGQRVAS